jgi:tetratricopeptide (TPR) repeat protein
MFERTLTEFRIVVYYISLFLWAPPGRLNLDYDYPLSVSFANPPTTCISLIAIIGLIAVAAYSAKKNRVPAFCILWFFFTQAIESTIIGIELIFEHRTYIPFMMTSLLLVLMVLRVIKNKTVSYAFLSAVVIVFSVWTFQRNQTWQDPVLFWTDTLTKSTDKPRAYKNLAFAYQQKGEWALAICYYKKTLSMNNGLKTPDFATYANLGAAFMKQARFFEAAYFYSEALAQKDAAANIIQPLAFALANIGELDAAKNHYLLALSIYPENESVKKKLNDLAKFLNKFPDPDTQIRQMLATRPNDPALLLKQGDIYDQQSLPEQAITVYLKADGLTMEDDEMLRKALLSRLSRLFAITYKYDAAISAYQRLIRMTPDNAMLYYNVAAVYAASGDIAQAEAFLEKAEKKGLNVTEKIKKDPNFEKIKKIEAGR